LCWAILAESYEYVYFNINKSLNYEYHRETNCNKKNSIVFNVVNKADEEDYVFYNNVTSLDDDKAFWKSLTKLRDELRSIKFNDDDSKKKFCTPLDLLDYAMLAENIFANFLNEWKDEFHLYNNQGYISEKATTFFDKKITERDVYNYIKEKTFYFIDRNIKEFCSRYKLNFLNRERIGETSEFGFKTNAFILNSGIVNFIHTLFFDVLIKPKMNNERIKRQQGAFLLHSPFLQNFDLRNNKKDSNTYKYFRTGYKQSIVIPQKYKTNILNDLASIGITSHSLFPDLDMYYNEIERKYNSKQ
jgi:hypothetical protein